MTYSKKKNKRTIEKIREAFPEFTWTYGGYHAFPTYTNNEGWGITAFARFAPRYDGDDEGYETEYRRSDTNEVVYLGVAREFWPNW